MIYRYTLADAERWAQFSGDRNPIHFDLTHAHHMGGEHIMVHGMRAMLDMKRALSERLIDCGITAEWLKFTARLRRPLYCEHPYKLSVDRKGERFNVVMCDGGDNSESYTARLAPTLPQTWSCEHPGNLRKLIITPSLKSYFPGQADSPAERWVFLDALLFQELLSSPELLLVLKEVDASCQSASLLDLFSRVPVIQTHHEVQFSTELFVMTLDGGLYVDILPAQVVGNNETGFVIRIEIRAWIGPRPLLSTSVTFRTLPREITH